MALYSKSEFSKICGKAAPFISMAIKRGKIILSGDLIDDQILENAIVKKKWQDETGITATDNFVIEKLSKKLKEKIEVSKIIAKNPTDPNRKKDPVKKITISEPEDFDGVGLDSQKKRAEIEFKRAQIRKLKIEENKLRGLNIPTAMVSNLIFMLGHSFMSNYKNGANQLLMELGHKIKLDSKIESEFKGKLIDLINRSHENAVNEAKQNLKNIIEANSVVSQEPEIDEDEN